jgi:hypothetical protein
MSRYRTVVTTDATLKQLVPIPIPTNTLREFTVVVSGESTLNVCATIRYVGAVKNLSGTTSLVGTPTVTVMADIDAAAWTGSATVSGGYLVINVQGGAGQTVNWTPMRNDKSDMQIPPPGD